MKCESFSNPSDYAFTAHHFSSCAACLCTSRSPGTLHVRLMSSLPVHTLTSARQKQSISTCSSGLAWLYCPKNHHCVDTWVRGGFQVHGANIARSQKCVQPASLSVARVKMSLGYDQKTSDSAYEERVALETSTDTTGLTLCSSVWRQKCVQHGLQVT